MASGRRVGPLLTGTGYDVSVLGVCAAFRARWFRKCKVVLGKDLTGMSTFVPEVGFVYHTYVVALARVLWRMWQWLEHAPKDAMRRACIFAFATSTTEEER